MAQYINMIDSDLGIVSKSSDTYMPNLSNSTPLEQAVKEMFNERKIRMITDFSDDEVKLATRILMIAEMKNIQIWKVGLNFYMELLLSRKRTSRKELLQAIEGATKKTSILDKLNPANWGVRNEH